MTRCIHCTRCIRFAEDIAGVPELGAFGRGEHMEVGTFLEQAISSELSGNLVDLCPVGALTAKPYAFLARPWELTKTESIDVMDAVGSNIRVDSRGEMVLRVLPRIHEDINEEWISDKTRHACDGLRVQRLDRPYVRNAEGRLIEATWAQAFAAIAEKLKLCKPEEMAALAGNMACAESMFALKELMTQLGCKNIDCRQEGAKLPYAARADYLFNTGIAGIEQADVLLLVGANPRHEAPLVNARIRKATRNGLKVFSVGAEADLSYRHEWLGKDPRLLNDILSGRHPVCDALKGAKSPMIIVGMSALARQDGEEIYAAARAAASKYNMLHGDWNGFNVLHHAAARVAGLDLGFVPGREGRDIAGIIEGARRGDIRFVYLLGVDEIDMTMLGSAFVVYQGHHGDDGAHRADVVLPAAAYTEKDATYVNLEGRVQRTRRAIFPPGQAKEDWTILRALSETLGKALPYITLADVRKRMVDAVPHLGRLDVLEPTPLAPQPAKDSYHIENMPFEPLFANFYMTDPISRASKTMADCTREILGHGMQRAA